MLGIQTSTGENPDNHIHITLINPSKKFAASCIRKFNLGKSTGQVQTRAGSAVGFSNCSASLAQTWNGLKFFKLKKSTHANWIDNCEPHRSAGRSPANKVCVQGQCFSKGDGPHHRCDLVLKNIVVSFGSWEGSPIVENGEREVYKFPHQCNVPIKQQLGGNRSKMRMSTWLTSMIIIDQNLPTIKCQWMGCCMLICSQREPILTTGSKLLTSRKWPFHSLFISVFFFSS